MQLSYQTGVRSKNKVLSIFSSHPMLAHSYTGSVGNAALRQSTYFPSGPGATTDHSRQTCNITDKYPYKSIFPMVIGSFNN